MLKIWILIVLPDLRLALRILYECLAGKNVWPQLLVHDEERMCAGAGRGGRGWSRMQLAQMCMVCMELALPRPLSRECLLLSQTLQEAPLDGQALGVAFVV